MFQAISRFFHKAARGYHAHKTWKFWRALIIAFCVTCIVGHWMEMLYCWCMDSLFGIVEDDYAIFLDPWYHPYWVYGIGAVFMTLLIEPIKHRIIKRSATLPRALLKMFALTVFLAMLMELVIGLIVNQPDAMGNYPYWDNSQLPLNVFGQAWLVNDVFIGLAAMVYLWVLFPLIYEGLALLSEKAANIVFAFVVVAFAGCSTLSYCELVRAGTL